MNDLGSAAYRTLDLPVAGGSLRVAQWGAGGPALLCVHGITANHTEFQALADQLGPGYRLVAPDLRGRGRSNGITGPWGMAAHAEDLVAVLDHLQLERADLLLGHSMGGFVSAVAAAQHPGRFAQVLMVDGGLPLMNAGFLGRLPFSDFLIGLLVRRILGPSIDRLSMTFESIEAYRSFWRKHPALADEWSGYVEQYIDYDLEGQAPALRPSTRLDSLMRDVRTQLIEDLVPRSLKAIDCPVRFLRAPRGIMNDKPLYPEDKLARAGAGMKAFSSATVPEVNHFTILLGERGASAVAAEVRSLLGR